MSGRMDDPENQAARVFVGGVNPNTPELILNERFSQYGNVKGKLYSCSLVVIPPPHYYIQTNL